MLTYMLDDYLNLSRQSLSLLVALVLLVDFVVQVTVAIPITSMPTNTSTT